MHKHHVPPEPPANAVKFASLHRELDELSDRYGDYLKQESVGGDVAYLKDWIESYWQGSEKAGRYIEQHGLVLLEHIKETLKCAEAEMQRIDEESPAGEHFTGGRAHRISKAVALAAEAEAELEHVLGSGEITD